MKSSHGMRRSRTKIRFLFSLIIAAVCIAASFPDTKAEEYYGAWLQQYLTDSQVSQGGTSVAMDSRGNVAATGFTFINGRQVYYTAKYEARSGKLMWSRTYDGGVGENIATSVAMDSDGHVIVTGYSVGAGTGRDYVTIKYHSQTGADYWVLPRRYNGPADGADEALKVLVDSGNNIIVTGRSMGSGTNYDIATIKYTPQGTVDWGAVRYNSASNRDDRPFSAVLDGSSNTIIVGEADIGSTTKFVTIKYLSETGAQAWNPVLYTPPGSPSFYGGTGVAVDAQNNIYTVGIATQLNSRRLYHLLKYDSAGAFQWSRTSVNDVDAPAENPVYVSADADGNAIVSYTSEDSEGITAIETVKHDADNGGTLWSRRSPAPGGEDLVRGQIVDGSSNTLLIGASNSEQQNLDYYFAKYSSEGDLLYDGTFNGNFGGTGGTDIPRGIAVDGNSNTVITGEVAMDLNGTGRTRMTTIKLNRFLAFTGDAVPASGIENAEIASLGTPAVSGTGGIAARVVLRSGKRKVAAIFTQNPVSGTVVPAVQGADALGVSGATFKSLMDPVISPSGRYAFVAGLGGVKGSTAATLWSNFTTGNLTLLLRQGEDVAGLDAGTRLKSIDDISLQTGSLVALIQVTGSEVSKNNDTVLLRITGAGNLPLLRTGQELVSGDPETAIKSITTLTPAQGSPGQGRWHANDRVVARVTLANKQTVVLAVTMAGAITTLQSSGTPANNIADGAEWKSFGLPSVGGTAGRYAFLGTLQRGKGEINAGNDTVLMYSAAGGMPAPFAREGNTAPDSGDATYGSFRDPVSNDAGEVAFLATLKGKDAKGANSGLYWGTPGNIHLLARTGDAAPDTAGEVGDARWSTFLSMALPGGNGGGPIFLAKLSGKGVNGKNNLGVWGVNSSGTEIRQIIRTGEQFGSRAVAKIAVLQPARGSFGAARSYNASGVVSFLVTFTDKTQAIVNLAAP
ncbi:MAG: DUF7453 family protein [Chthoniobacteraceae bacterium]